MSERGQTERLGAILTEALALTRHGPSHRLRKGAQDYVTDIDLAVDRFLSGALPAIADVPVLSEERAIAAGTRLDAYWIVDPLDGTGNFIAGLPLYGVSVALVDRDGPRLAAVASGADGALWTARRGAGAARNGMRLDLGRRPSELIVLSTGLLDQIAAAGPDVFTAFRRLGKIRNLGAQALHLCGAAAGQFAAVLSREARFWDEAAGGLILREAGGVWRSAADLGDWTDPAGLVARGQHSMACHPAVAQAVTDALRPVWGRIAAGAAEYTFFDEFQTGQSA